MEYDIESILLNLGIDDNYISHGSKKKINGYASITEATENDISFCWYDGERALSLISNSNAGVILCKKNIIGFVKGIPNKHFIFVDDPRLCFINILEFMQKKERKTGISSTAILSDTAKIGSNCYIGEYTIIRDNCVIGDNTTIGERVVILEGCSMGNNCILQSGVTIGSDGFSFDRDSNGELKQFPHSKGVK